MSEIERLRWIYSFWALAQARGDLNEWGNPRAEAVSLALDNEIARAHPALNVRQRQEVRWEDRLHKTLLAEVAWA